MDFVVGLLFLTLMEIVLGIDNIVFITIISSKLPKEQQPLARKLGLGLALISRLLLLLTLSWVVNHLQEPLFTLTQLGIPEDFLSHLTGGDTIGGGHGSHEIHLPAEIVEARLAEANGVSWRDIVLLVGGLFLIGKSVFEVHDELGNSEHKAKPKSAKMFSVLVQIAVLDIIFSLDSVITAVGMVDSIWVMSAAIIMAVVVMLIFAEPISHFVETNPTLKMLALSFLILIGVMLVAESIGAHIDKGYIYFAMFFALIVEVLNIRLRKNSTPAAEA